MKVELRQVIGKFRDSLGRVRRVGHDMDFLLLDGQAIATMNQVPGAPIKLYAGVALTPAEKSAVEEAIAAKRGGLKPSAIRNEIVLPGELLDDEDELDELVEAGEETEVDGE